jgi:Effector-associated domain 11/TIR domain
MEDLLAPIRQLVALSRLDQAIRKMGQLAEQFQLGDNEVVLLSARLAQLEREERMGIVEMRDATIRRNRLTHDILSCLDQWRTRLPEPTTTPPQYSTESIPTATAPSQQQSPNREQRMFISYSKSDRAYLDRFKSQLKPLERGGKLRTWDDTQLVPGEVWEQAIERELQAADIIVFLVSADLLNTDFIWEKELPIALARQSSQTARIVPILLRPCGWEDTEFAQFSMLPPKGKPIAAYSPEDEGWQLVYEQIKRLTL